MEWMEAELSRLAEKSVERRLCVSDPAKAQPGYIVRDGRKLLNLSSNDYLGLAGHPAVAEAMRSALLTEGAGAGASRLITGNRSPYALLEAAVADWQRSEAALVYANGYMANISAVTALAGREDAVFSDRFNHASIVDGILLSRAEHVRYRHNDTEHLRWLLNKHGAARRKLIVTDAIFSMDGDLAKLEELICLKREYGAMLMVDEAHSGGLYAEHGEGLIHRLGLQAEVDVHIGTFSKAFGVYGAYICGSRTLIRWLLNKSRPLIYSTALPPSVPAGIMQALAIVKEEGWRRDRLFSAAKGLRQSLRAAGFQIGIGDSPIVPVIVGDNQAAIRLGAALEEKGIAAVAIRPPTVPEGTARLRLTVTAAHSPAELAAAAAVIRETAMELGVLAR